MRLLPRSSRLLVTLATFALGLPLHADSIVETINGQEKVLVDNVLITSVSVEGSRKTVSYQCLQDGKFIKESYKRGNAGELKEVRSSVAQRNALRREWTAAGWTVDIRDERRRIATVQNFCIYPKAPEGFNFIEHPDAFPHIVLATNPPTTIPLDQINRIEVSADGRLRIKQNDGRNLELIFAEIQYHNKNYGQCFGGYEDESGEFKRYYFNLRTIREIRFLRPKK